MQNSIIKVLKCFWFFSKFPPKRNSFVRNSFQSDIFSRFKYPGNIRSYQNKIHYIFPIYFSAFLFMLVAESNDFSPCHNQMLCCDSEVCLEKRRFISHLFPENPFLILISVVQVCWLAQSVHDLEVQGLTPATSNVLQEQDT